MKSSLIVVISLFAVSLSCQAAALSLEGCAAIEDPVDRLACYDTLAGRLPAGTAKTDDSAPGVVDPVPPGADVITPVASTAAPTPPAVELTPDAEAAFGLEKKQKSEKEQVQQLQLKWVKKMKDSSGKWNIILENGQVWRQTDTIGYIFRNPEQRVVISRGILGSFFMGEPDRRQRIRVKRVK